MEYITIKQASEKWGIGTRIVTLYCTEGRISGAIKKGNLWLIPEKASKPEDRRKKSAESQTSTVSSLNYLSSNVDMLAGVIEFFPYPIQVYTPDGIMILTNEACLRVMHIPSKDHIVGKFNVLKDPIIDHWGEEVRSQIARSFQGEMVQFENISMPIRGIIERFETDELCFDNCYQNIICYPIFDKENQLAYVVHVFITTKLYDGKAEIVKAKEYIDQNWLEEFDMD